MRSVNEIRTDIRRLKRAYHKITCGELRDIFRRYGDKQIYLIDAHGSEVPGAFYRVHEFIPALSLYLVSCILYTKFLISPSSFDNVLEMSSNTAVISL